MRQCHGVREAVVVANDGELVAFYLGDHSQPTELARELGTILSRQLLPRLYHHLDDFPLNANRKVDRRALGELAARLLQGQRP